MKKIILTFANILLISNLIFSQNNTKDTILLDEVLISEKVSTPYLIDKIKSKDIEVSSDRDIGDFLNQFPNVNTIKKGGIAADPVIRGLKYNQLNVQLDNGIHIEGGCPNRMDPVSSHVEIEDISAIEIVKGPYVLRYGPSFGGIVNLITARPEQFEKFTVHTIFKSGYETNWDGQKYHLQVKGGNQTVFFNISGGYKDYGNYSDGNGNIINSSFLRYCYSGELGFAFDKNNVLILSYNENHGRNVRYPALPMDEVADKTRIVSLDYKAFKITPALSSLNVKFYSSDVDHTMDNYYRPSYEIMQAVAHVDALNTGGRAEAGLNFGKHHLYVGADFENIDKDGLREMTMTMSMGGLNTISILKNRLWFEANILNTGVFAEYSSSFGKYDFIASLRADYNIADSEDTLNIENDDRTYFGDMSSAFLNLSGSTGITANINENLSASIAIGRGTRSPNMTERFIKFLTVGYDNYDYLGNPSLLPETNNQADITFKYKKKTVGSVYFNLFYSYIQNYIAAVKLAPVIATPKTQGAVGVKQFVNADYAILKGFEFGYSSPEKYKLVGNVSASYTYATISSAIKYILTNNQVTGEEIIDYDALPEIPPLEGTASLYANLMKGKLIPRVSWRVVADQYHVSQAFYEPSTPGFGLLDFRISYFYKKIINVNVGVDNIFDRAYYEHLNRKIVGTIYKLYEPGRIVYANIVIKI